MSNFKIISDSSCDFSPELAKEKNVEIVPFYISFDDNNYLKEGVDIQRDNFYSRLINERTFPKTSLPSVQDYIDVYRPYLEQGEDILSLCISSSLSGSYQSATNAANILLEEFPDRKISIIDTMQATFGQGILLMEAIKLRDENYTLENATDLILKIRETATLIFALDTLEYLQKGGRIGKAAAFAGGLLNIKPVLMFKDGDLKPVSKSRGKKKAVNSAIDILTNIVKENKDDYEFIVGHTFNPEEAEVFKNQLIENFGLNIKYPLINVGVTIGTHVGPGCVGVAFIKKPSTFL